MNGSGESQASSADVTLPAMTAGRRLFDDLRRAIETGRLRDGDRIAPIRELAAKYGIAFDTARATVGQLEKLSLVRRRRGAGTCVTARREIPSDPTHATTAPAVALMIDAKAHLFDHLTADLVEILQSRGLASIKVSWKTGAGIEQI